MEEGEKADKQFQDSFPVELREHSRASALFGGAFYFDKMNFLERAVIKKISGIQETVEKIDTEEIKKIADKLNS